MLNVLTTQLLSNGFAHVAEPHLFGPWNRAGSCLCHGTVSCSMATARPYISRPAMPGRADLPFGLRTTRRSPNPHSFGLSDRTACFNSAHFLALDAAILCTVVRGDSLRAGATVLFARRPTF